MGPRSHPSAGRQGCGLVSAYRRWQVCRCAGLDAAPSQPQLPTLSAGEPENNTTPYTTTATNSVCRGTRKQYNPLHNHGHQLCLKGNQKTIQPPTQSQLPTLSEGEPENNTTPYTTTATNSVCRGTRKQYNPLHNHSKPQQERTMYMYT